MKIHCHDAYHVAFLHFEQQKLECILEKHLVYYVLGA